MSHLIYRTDITHIFSFSPDRDSVPFWFEKNPPAPVLPMSLFACLARQQPARLLSEYPPRITTEQSPIPRTTIRGLDPRIHHASTFFLGDRLPGQPGSERV
jgi:hypothetical protein